MKAKVGLWAAIVALSGLTGAGCLTDFLERDQGDMSDLALAASGGLIALSENSRGEIEDALANTGQARVCALPNTCVLLIRQAGGSRAELESFMGVDITSDSLREILSNLEYEIDREKIELRIPAAREFPGQQDLPPIVSEAVNDMIGNATWFSGLVNLALDIITGFRHSREILDRIYLEFRHSLKDLTVTFYFDGRLRLQALLESEFSVDSHKRWDSGGFKEYLVRSEGNRLRIPMDIQARVDAENTKVVFEKFDLPVEFDEINLRAYHFKNRIWPFPDHEEHIYLRARLSGRGVVNPDDLNRLDFGEVDEFCLDAVIDVDADIKARLTFGWRALNSREQVRVCL